MAKTQSIGKCEICGAEFAKNSMGRHLKSCLAKNAVPSNRGKTRPTLHLAIEGQHLSEYWIHIETAADSTFGNVDTYLRDLWLECCGHLSAFRLPVSKRVPSGSGNLNLQMLKLAFRPFDDFESGFDSEKRLMGAKLGSRLKVGDKFDYEYDFGSTTPLKVKVVDKRDGTGKKGQIKLLARNLPPDIRCECGQPAVSVCTQCLWEGEGWLCKACGRKHDCDEEMFLPVVNSPRVGVCGYAG